MARGSGSRRTERAVGLALHWLGVRSAPWRRFNRRMKQALLATQMKTGTCKGEKGSWRSETDASSRDLGRAGQTALGALMLEVYYRYFGQSR